MSPVPGGVGVRLLADLLSADVHVLEGGVILSFLDCIVGDFVKRFGFPSPGGVGCLLKKPDGFDFFGVAMLPRSMEPVVSGDTDMRSESALLLSPELGLTLPPAVDWALVGGDVVMVKGAIRLATLLAATDFCPVMPYRVRTVEGLTPITPGNTP